MMRNRNPLRKMALISLSGLIVGVAFAQQPSISVEKVTGELPMEPFAPAWQTAPMLDVAVFPQQITQPRLEEASITKLTVQGLTDGKSIAWRLSWADDSPSQNVDVKRFSDAVAIELPLTPSASPFMGQKGGGKVQILYWKGLWQKDMDEGFQDVQDVHPNAWSDLYWLAEGKAPHKVPEDFEDPRSHQWFIAKQAGNPGAAFERSQPAQELVAEGWGSLTPQPELATSALGIWKEGRWTVVFSRPLTTDDVNDYQFKPGEKGQLAFAVWQGGADNRGGRKHWANWTAYQLP